MEDIMRNAFLLAIAIFSCSLSAVAEVESASQHNRGMASSLLGAKNPCGEDEGGASEANLISLAGIRPVSLIPEVNGVTSDSANASLLWSYYASFPQSATFPVEGGDCPGGQTEYFAPSAPDLQHGTLRYEYGGESRAVALSSAGPNPVSLDLGIGSLPEGSLRVPLRVSLSGRISVTYAYQRDYYRRYWQGFEGGWGWGCSRETEAGTRTFEREVSGEKEYSVEAGRGGWFWLNPPLSSRLPGNELGELLYFARRLPASLEIEAGGRKIAFSSPYRFAVLGGECGEQKVAGGFFPQGSLLVDLGNATAPRQLASDNLTYLPFQLGFGWEEGAGKRSLMLVAIDAFGGREELAKNFSVRAPSPFSGEAAAGGALAVRKAGEAETSASFPAGRKTPAAPPDFSALAALLALPFALWAWEMMRQHF